MNKYISIIVAVLVIVSGAWFMARNDNSVITEDRNVDAVGSFDSTLDQETEFEGIVSEEDNIIKLNNEENMTKTTSATLHTNKGDITIEFYGEQAPNTVDNFIKLAGENFYNGVKFHRVIKGFMIQGGDPLTKDDSKMDLWGTGGPGYKFGDEIGPNNKNDVDTIAMANAGPNTNGSQFFINVNANNFLDAKHTVFGKVVSGMDVVTMIENIPTTQGDRPIDPVIINSITLK